MPLNFLFLKKNDNSIEAYLTFIDLYNLFFMDFMDGV